MVLRLLTITGFAAALMIALWTLAMLMGAVRPAAAQDRCVRIDRQGDFETLVNVCDVCRNVRIIRSRPGSQVPVGREYRIQPRGTFPVPFKGPGRTRVKSELPCPGEPGGRTDLLQAFDRPDAAPECVSMERGGSGIVLVNRCPACRAVAIERVSAGGTERARDYMLISGASAVPVPPRGFASVGLLAEIACPQN